MKIKLKYLKLFEGISQSDIPYSVMDSLSYLNITIPSDIKELPEIYNQLTNEITGQLEIKSTKQLSSLKNFNNLTKIGYNFIIQFNDKLKDLNGFDNLTEIGGYLSISGNNRLKTILGFNNLNKISLGSLNIDSNINLTIVNGFKKIYNIIGEFSIEYNPNLIYITGFNNLTEINGNLNLFSNNKLIVMSIPYTIIKSVYYKLGINYERIYRFTSPESFINHPDIFQDFINKFDPDIHPDIVIKQIVENLELWGSYETKTKIYEYMKDLITIEQIELLPDIYKHKWNPKYANTGARGIAKMNTGRYLGTF